MKELEEKIRTITWDGYVNGDTSKILAKEIKDLTTEFAHQMMNKPTIYFKEDTEREGRKLWLNYFFDQFIKDRYKIK